MSIKKSITLLFLSSLFIMIALGVWIQRLEEKKNRQIAVTTLFVDAKELIPYIVDNNDKKLLQIAKKLELKRIKAQRGEIIAKRAITFGKILIYKEHKSYLLEIEYLGERYSFKSTKKLFEDDSYLTKLFLFADILLLFFIYIMIMRLVSPIKNLSSSMQKFSKGDFSNRMKEEGSFEIKEATRSFNKMADSLQQAIEDREDLLKYFGHEIRTPLAKAKYALQKSDLKLLNENLKDMENFVNEVLNMHLISEKNLKIESFQAHTLIVNSLNKTEIKDDSDVVVDIVCDFKIEGDLNYLSIALKNLIDNAIKYTQKYPVKILCNSNFIEIESFGGRVDEKENSSSGLGLGLTLSEMITNRHGYNLYYKYKDGKNIYGVSF